MLPNIRLMARAFHRVPCVASTPSTNAVAGSASGMQRRRLSGSVRRAAWEGAQNEDHVTNEGDKVCAFYFPCFLPFPVSLCLHSSCVLWLGNNWG